MAKKIGKYQLEEIIGEGSFGRWLNVHDCRVRRAVDETTRAEVAIKEIEKEKIKQVDLVSALTKEISLLQMANHPNIVKLIEVLASKSKIYVVLEYVQGSDLYDKISKVVKPVGQCEKIAEPLAKEIFLQIINGLEHCNGLKIVHRDLKPENILVTTEGVVKISGSFG